MCKQCIFHLKNNHSYYTLVCMKNILFHWKKTYGWHEKKTLFFLEKNQIFHMWICLKSEQFHFKYSGPPNRTNILCMTTSASRRLNISWIMLKIVAFFIITLFSRLCVRVGISLTQVKHLHDRINSLKGGGGGFTTKII